MALPAAGSAATGATTDANLVPNPSFEFALTGWSGYRSSITRVQGGTDGAWSASASARYSGTWSIYPSQSSVFGATAGTQLLATAAVRARSGSRTVCLQIRERTGSPSTVVAFSEQCLTPSSAWRSFPVVSYTVRRNAAELEVYAYGPNGRKGDAFDVDAFSLTRGSAAAPPPLPPPPPPGSLAVSLTAPTTTAVAGTVTVAASVTSGTAAQVDFLAGGTLIGSDSTSPYSLAWDSRSVADNSVSLVARASSSTGLTASSAVHSVRVDNTAPETAFTSGPAGTVASTAADFTFTATEAASFQCELVGAGWSSCTSPRTLTNLASGTYTFRVRATDSLGNVDPTPATATWTVSVAAPPPPPPPSGTPSCDRVASTSGSDSNAGTVSAPFRSAQRLADSLSAGQTGCLRSGTYTTASAYILSLTKPGYTIRSYPGERAKLVGIIMISSTANAVTLSHLDVEGTGTMNTIKVHSADVVIEDNDITNLMRPYGCMILGDNSGWGVAVRTIIRRNRIHDCGSLANYNKDHGIYAQALVDGQILNNVFWNIAATAIQLYPNAQRTRFAYNVIDGGSPSVRGGVVFGGESAYQSRDNTVELNVIAYAASANIETWWGGPVGSGNLARKNCVWAGGEANIRGTGFTSVDNLVADPLFVNRGARDYRLSAASLCRLHIGIDPASLLN